MMGKWGRGGEKFMPAEILAKFQFDWCILWKRSEDPVTKCTTTEPCPSSILHGETKGLITFIPWGTGAKGFRVCHHTF